MFGIPILRSDVCGGIIPALRCKICGGIFPRKLCTQYLPLFEKRECTQPQNHAARRAREDVNVFNQVFNLIYFSDVFSPAIAILNRR